MRFNHHNIISDLPDFPQPSEHGFTYMRWFLRELMFRPRAALPERLSPTMAVLPLHRHRSAGHHLTFKVLGIVLMAIEIWVATGR